MEGAQPELPSPGRDEGTELNMDLFTLKLPITPLKYWPRV